MTDYVLMAENTPDNDTPADNLPWVAIGWWFMLAVSVIAIPSLAYVIVTLTGTSGVIGLAVFMVCCWACTYFGMHLMSHPNMNKKRDFTRD